LGAGLRIKITRGGKVKIEFVNETVEVVMIIVVIVAFLLLFKMRNKLKAKDKVYVQIRNMLREKLAPLGFTAEEKVNLDNVAKYKRDGLLVELYFDYREREYSFFASSGVQDPNRPPRQVAVTFFSTEYNAEKLKAISDALQEWLKSME
jgi:Fe2+ transport system protein FeoA